MAVLQATRCISKGELRTTVSNGRSIALMQHALRQSCSDASYSAGYATDSKLQARLSSHRLVAV